MQDYEDSIIEVNSNTAKHILDLVTSRQLLLHQGLIFNNLDAIINMELEIMYLDTEKVHKSVMAHAEKEKQKETMKVVKLDTTKGGPNGNTTE